MAHHHSAPRAIDPTRTRARVAPRATRALIAAALLAVPIVATPQAAFAAPGNDLGAITVDCDPGYLDPQTVLYLEIGDTFVVSNLEYAPCTIGDPDDILFGEDADFSGQGPGVLAIGGTSDPITIQAPGTFTIADGDGNTTTFTVLQGISFRNSIFIGGGAAVGDSFEYSRVFYTGSQYVDATVTIVDISGLVSLGTPGLINYLDGEDDNFPLSPSIEVDESTSRGYVTIRIDFYESGNPDAPVSLDNVVMTVKDIDSEQYIAALGVSSFSLSSTPATVLTATYDGDLLTVAELNDVGSSDDDEDHWVVLRFGTANSLTLTVGANQSGGASFDALFTEADWTEAPVTQAPSDVAPQPELAETGVSSELTTPLAALFGSLLAAGAAALAVSRRRAPGRAATRSRA